MPEAPDSGRATPPFVGEPRPRGESGCARWLGDRNCDKPPVQHVAWTEDLENGPCCPEHWAEARERWDPYDSHPFGGWCLMPETEWHFSWDEPTGEGFCAFPIEDDETIEAVISAEVEAFQDETANV